MVRVLLVLLAAAGTASADEYRYIQADHPYEHAAVPAPLPAAVFGSMMIDAAARLRSLRRTLPFAADEAAPTAAAVPAAAAPGGAAPEPTRAELDRSSLSWRAGKPQEPGERERIAVLFARKSFRVGAEAARLKVLKLRARYQDALVVHLNGVEVARRYLDPSAPALGYSPRSRYGEWETIPIPLGRGLLKQGENQITLEVRPAATRRVPTLEFELSGGAALSIARGPLVQRVAATSATIVFETDLPTRAELRYGRSVQQLSARAAAAAAPSSRHVVQLDGLVPGSRVFYQVILDGTPQPVRSFATAPRPGEPLRFAVYGDVRTGHDVHARIVRALVDEAPDLVLSTGDAVMAGHDEGDWQRFFGIAEELLALVPMYPVCGNHDLGATPVGGRTFEEIFALWPAPTGRPRSGAWYAFDVAGLHFVMLDSNRYGDPAQLEWLEQDLALARKAGARAVFVSTHHGPWSRGPHGGNADMLATYVPVLERHGVTLLFAGHDHLYQRGRVGGLRYVVSGGGGAPLYPLRCGGKGRPACEPDGAEATFSEHHYLLVEVFRDHGRLCPRRPDGTPLEECVSFSLSDASWRLAARGTDPAVPAPRSPSAGP